MVSLYDADNVSELGCVVAARTVRDRKSSPSLQDGFMASPDSNYPPQLPPIMPEKR